MIGNRKCAFALSTAFAIFCSALPAIAAQFDGNWSMVAVTTRGHCGKIPMGLGISRGRIYSTGGSFVSYPIQLGGRVSASGQRVRPDPEPRDLVQSNSNRLTPIDFDLLNSGLVRARWRHRDCRHRTGREK